MKNLFFQSGYRRILLYIFCRNGSSVPPGGPRPLLFFFHGDDIFHQGIFYGNCVRRIVLSYQLSSYKVRSWDAVNLRGKQVEQ